jgi:exosortase F-associated protein
MSKKTIVVIFAILGLVAVRVMGTRLFYDPLIPFFHQGDYHLQDLPEIVYWKFLGSLFFRFSVNTFFTLIIVNTVFKKVDLLKLTALIFGLTFMLLAPILLILVWKGGAENYQFLFYTRRILIHPVLTLILIPAYIYHQRNLKTKSND